MAATTRLLARSGLGVAVLNFDDATLLATGVTIANISGTETIVFYIIVSGTTFSRTVGIGQTSIITFASPIQCSTGINPVTSAPTFIMAGVTEYGIGSV